MAKTITQKTKGKAKKRPKDVQPTRTKGGKDLVPLMVRSYLTHNPSNITCMQIVSSNNNRMSRTNISRWGNLPPYSKGCNLPFQSSNQWKHMKSWYVILLPISVNKCLESYGFFFHFWKHISRPNWTSCYQLQGIYIDTFDIWEIMTIEN
jgi:hypothetical protein